MQYKYADILAAMAERAKVSDTPWDVIQWQNRSGDWRPFDSMAGMFSGNYNLRIKPRTVRIGNREVSEPLRIDELANLKFVWYPNFENNSMVDRFLVHTDYAKRVTERGLARRTEAEARELAEALLEVVNGP